MVGQVRTPLLILLAAVALILLIACSNVANLLLARAAVRRKEIALRLALGAGRRRLIAQLLTESFCVCLSGACLGGLLAAASVRFLSSYAASELPRAAEIAVDGRVLLFTLLAAVACSVLCGLLPALVASRADQNAVLKEGSRSLGNPSRSLARRALVAAEVALALLVSIGAGLLVRSFERVLSTPLGFRTDRLLTFQLNPSPAKYKTPAQVQALYARLMTELRSLPSVQEIATTYPLPFTSQLSRTRFLIEGAPPPESGRFPIVQLRVVSPDYFPLMAIPLRQGRNFTLRDTEPNVAPACIVNEAFVRRFLPTQDPIGQKVVLGVVDPKQVAIPIVGVARDVRDLELTLDPEPLLYFPGLAGSVVLRTNVPPLSLASAARRIVSSVDPELPVTAVQSMDQLVAASLARRRLAMLLLSGFSGLALLLAAIGLYGVVSYSVAQRTPEIGLRMALGAGRSRLFRSVLGESLVLGLAGLVAGLVLAFAFTRFLSSQLYAVGATDVFTFSAVCAIMLAVTILAALLPACRAVSVEPLEALRDG